ncbi:MAG: sulfatase-like hydrolase/transferase [Gammaproteobacteria bacterium]|nr:sulfatase-like hydrolase/transferase [Gammaproteobacteria bacterium]
MTRYIIFLLIVFVQDAFLNTTLASSKAPNIIIVLADDLGYGDVGVYGAELIKTPNLDKLARNGVRLTQHYSSGNVCTPSRAGLLTGRYPIRTGLANRTLAIGDSRGMRQSEATLAEQLNSLGYRTAIVGKWHLGDKPEYHPLEHGFDEFFGVLYSNDEPEQALLKNRDAIENPIDPQNLAVNFVKAASDFIEQNEDGPFFLYLASTSPHKPLIPSAQFAGKSKAGAYGDVVEELDWGVGQIVSVLKKKALYENTLIIFTSDNGPFPEGSPGGLRGGKGTAWEGGYRVPFIASWPGQIKENTESSAMSMNIDITPTLIKIAGGKTDSQPVLDGKDIYSVLTGSQQSPHEVLYFFNNERIAALRTEKWRLTLSDYPPWRDAEPVLFAADKHLFNQMYDMELAPDQQYDLSRDHPLEKRKLEKYLSKGREILESLSTQPNSTQYVNVKDKVSD